MYCNCCFQSFSGDVKIANSRSAGMLTGPCMSFSKLCCFAGIFYHGIRASIFGSFSGAGCSLISIIPYAMICFLFLHFFYPCAQTQITVSL